VLDAFFAMTAARPYGEIFTDEGALAELQKGAGALYDPEVVDALASALKPQD